MSCTIFGGIEGGGTKSHAILYNHKGEKLASVEGPNTNHWGLGMEKCQNRINDLINCAKKEANLPESIVLKSLGLSFSGCEHEETSNELKSGLMVRFPNLSENIAVWSDTVAPIMVAHEEGGIVIISGTGSNALLINPDGSQFQCGGLGHMLGDEGGAYWLALKLIKIYVDEQDHLNPPPHKYSTAAMWNCVKTFLGIETGIDLLPHFYRDFNKSKIALLTEKFSSLAKEGDELCQWGFKEAGRFLAKHLLAVARHADEKLYKCEGGLPVVCVGSVWKSWDLLMPGFIIEMNSAESVHTNEVSLITLTTDVASGAAYLAAKLANLDMVKNSGTYKVFYHYKRNINM